jgi:AcrR family transcriptional regulator
MDTPAPPTPEASTLRERKKTATREALSAAARDLAILRGLENVRVEDIAKAACVSPRTYNNYFASREEAICAAGAERAARVKDTLLARPADEPIVRAVAETVLRTTAHPTPLDRTHLAFIVSTPALRGEYLKVNEQVERGLAEAIAVRTGSDLEHDLFPRVLAASVAGAVRVATEFWLRPENTRTYGWLLRQCLDQALGQQEGGSC